MDDDGGIDIISNLPREILCHILSFLPTKYAVGTCILSTKWKNLYSLIPNLIVQLDDTLLLHPQPLSSSHLVSFMCFVNRLLYVTLRDVNSILAFDLNCRYFNDGQQIGNWVRAALCLNIKEFSLQMHLLKNPTVLFDSLFGCNIVTLNLFLYFDDFAPECRFSLPNLTTLSVKHTKCYVVNALIASCPLLEKLIVDDCICSFGEKLQICSPSLKALKLYIGSFSRSGEIELDTPKLEYLSCCGFLALNYSVRSLNSLWGAYFNLDEDAAVYAYQYGERAIELVKACSNAGCLGLSDAFISVSFFLYISTSFNSLFYNI